MRVLIACAGDGTRWGNHTGVPKHLVRLAGEPILERAVRLVVELAPGVDVRVVVNDLDDTRYKVSGSKRATARLGSAAGDVDKIASSRHLWAKTGPTVVLFGDVWWHRDALAAVLAGRDEWAAFGRIVGAGGELFAFHFPAGMAPVVDAAVGAVSAQVDRLATAGFDGAPIPGGWALYRTLCGVDPLVHGNHGNFVPVADPWTNDMDTRTDWDEWCLQWATTPEAERPR